VNADELVGVKVAVNECDPRASDVVVSCPVPLDTVTGLLRGEPLSENCTVPTAFDGVTVAVIVTVAPGTAVSAGETPSDVVVVTGTGAVIVYGVAASVVDAE